MGRIGLFGGTFDPPHRGHIDLALAALERVQLDKIIFIPAGNPPHKQDLKKTDKLHRYRMVELATQNFSRFEVSDFDIKNEKPNYSYITIGHFKKKYPNDEIYFIIGADSLRDLPFWMNYKELVTLCKFIVVPRPGISDEDYFKNFSSNDTKPDFLFLDGFSYDLSSTELREKLTSGYVDNYGLPDGVLEYITANNLYSKESL